VTVRGAFTMSLAAVAMCAALSGIAQESTGGRDGTGARGRFRAPATQVVAIKAGRVFDSRAGTASSPTSSPSAAIRCATSRRCSASGSS